MEYTAITADQQGALATLADRINEAHHAATAALNAGLDHAFRAGELLLEAKRRCDHGEWRSWLEANFDGSARTARGYMLIAKRRPEIEAKWQRGAILSLRQAAALTAPKPKDKLQCVKRAVEYLRQASDQATTAEEIRAVRDLALDASNIAGEEVLRMERVLGSEITKLDKQRPDPAHTRLLADEHLAGTLPDLSPDCQFMGGDPADLSYFVEIHPSKKHPGYYHLAHYRDMDTDDPEVIYDSRPIRYDKTLLAHVLEHVHRIKPIWWNSKPAADHDPWFVTADGIPGRCHV